MAEGDDNPLCTTADRPGKVTLGGAGTAAGQDKILQRWQAFVVPVQGALQPFDVFVTNHTAAGDGKFAPQVKQMVLNAAQALIKSSP